MWILSLHKKIEEDKAHEKYVSDFSVMYVFFPFVEKEEFLFVCVMLIVY